MQYEKALSSKSGKQIGLLVIESSKYPKATVIETHGGFVSSKEKVAKENSLLIEFLVKNEINYIAIDLSNNGTQKDQPIT